VPYITQIVAAYIIQTLIVCSNNTHHEHNEHLTLNMLRIIRVDNIIFAMGSAKNRKVPY
jgi:hypothetical protein